MKNLFPILLAIALCSCAHRPTIYHAPDTTKLDRSLQKSGASALRVHKAVTAAKATHAQVQGEVDALKVQAKDEGAQIEQLRPKLSELLRVAPPELRDQIDAVRMQVEVIAEDHPQLVARIETVTSLQRTEGAQIEEANAADKQHGIDMGEMNAEVTATKADGAALAQKATEESAARVIAENKVRELESKNWIRRAIEALAGIAILFVGFLWFTGKLTLSAASIAAKIP